MTDLAPALTHLRHPADLAWEATPIGLTAPEGEQYEDGTGAYFLATTMGPDLFVCLYLADSDDPYLVDAAPDPHAPHRRAALIRRLIRGFSA